MIIFSPMNDTAGAPVCSALEAYHAGRPPHSQATTVTFWTLFALLSLLWLGSIAWFWRERNSPVFGPLRPFWLNLELCISHILFLYFVAVNAAEPNTPCWFSVFSLLFGLGGCAVNFFIRQVVFAMESQFAKLAARETVNGTTKEQDATTISTSDHAMGACCYSSTAKLSFFARCVIESILVLSCCKSIEQVDIRVIARTKNAVLSIALLFLLPMCVAYIVLLASKPVLAHCVGCPLFLDTALAFVCCLLMYNLVSMRMAYITMKQGFEDVHGLFREFKLLLFLVVPVALLISLLIVLDPGDVSHDRLFNFEWLSVLLILLYWYVCVGEQIWAVHRHNSRIAAITHRQPFSKEILVNLSNEDAAAFRRFTQKQFSVEHLNFVLDVVSGYQRYFSEKGETWRASKARRITDMYIASGGTMEINISSACRNQILSAMNDAQQQQQPEFDLFDEAVSQVVNGILLGIWVDFVSTTGFVPNSPGSGGGGGNNKLNLLLAVSPLSPSSSPGSANSSAARKQYRSDL